jgi:hypothetical protein
MQKAQKNLEQSQPDEAQKDEEEALKDLDDAKKDLEEQLEELRRMAEEEKVVQLQVELRKIIEIEDGVLLKATRELDTLRKKKGALNREEVLRTKSLGKAQEDLGRNLEEVKRKVKEQNVDVFAYVMDSAAADMADAAVSLKDTETGSRTQDLQADAVRKLKDLVEAFDFKRREDKKRAAGAAVEAEGAASRRWCRTWSS